MAAEVKGLEEGMVRGVEEENWSLKCTNRELELEQEQQEAKLSLALLNAKKKEMEVVTVYFFLYITVPVPTNLLCSNSLVFRIRVHFVRIQFHIQQLSIIARRILTCLQAGLRIRSIFGRIRQIQQIGILKTGPFPRIRIHILVTDPDPL